MLAAIEKSKKNSLEKFLFAIGIKGIGEKNAKLLAKKFVTLKNLSEISYDTLNSIPDIGPVLAKNIVDFFRDEQNLNTIKELEEIGVNTTYLGKQSTENPNFAGKRIVVTGTLKNYTRDEIQSLIEENGGLWSSSVTKNTFAVVVGENPGSKYDKAKELNVPIWDEEKFQKMIEEA